MKRPVTRWREHLVVGMVFVAVLLIHFCWTGLFPPVASAQEGWAAVPAASQSWLARYIAQGHFWLGYSYALSLAFAVHALAAYRRQRFCSTRHLVVGGITWSGFLGLAGCFLVGCCGSPMLGVYLSLFGARFLPFAKPLVALVTTIFIAATWWWTRRRLTRAATSDCLCSAPNPPAPHVQAPR